MNLRSMSAYSMIADELPEGAIRRDVPGAGFCDIPNSQYDICRMKVRIVVMDLT
jgi:hypothetical protein